MGAGGIVGVMIEQKKRLIMAQIELKENLIKDDTVFIENYYINASGEFIYNSEYRYTPDYIEVKPNTTYFVSMNKTTNTTLSFTVPFYNAEKAFVERRVAISLATTAGTYTGSFTTTSQTKYIRISVPRLSNTIIVEKQ